MLTDYLKNLKSKRTYLNIFILFSGYFIAQLIVFGSLPVLSRIYNKELFGIFFVYSTLVAILSMLCTLQYDLAIVLAPNDEDAINLLALNVIVVFVNSVILLFIIILFFNYINSILGKKQLGDWLFLIPLSVFFVGLYQAFNSWNNRKKEYKNISIANISKSSTMVGVQIGSGYTRFLNSGLFIGIISGQFIATFFLILRLLYKERYLLYNIKINRIITLAKKYKDLPIFNTMVYLTNKTSVQIPIILLSAFFGAASAGLYGMADRLINVPLGMVNQSIAKVFYREASERYNNKDNFFNLVKNTYIKLFILAIIPYTVIFIFAPKFSTMFLGEKWEEVGYFIRAVVPWLFLAFLNSPISSIITILNKQRSMIVYNVFILTARVIALYIGYKVYNSDLISIALFSAVGVFFNLILMFYFYAISKRQLF